MTIIHRLLFIALALPATAAQATGTEDGNASPAPRFKIEIAGGFDYSPSKLTGNHSVITSPDGVVESDLTATKEDLRLLNRRNTYKLEQQTVDLRLSYRLYKQLHVWAGIGVVNSSASNRYTDGDEEIRSKSVSENPEFLLKGGLNYTHPLEDTRPGRHDLLAGVEHRHRAYRLLQPQHRRRTDLPFITLT